MAWSWKSIKGNFVLGGSILPIEKHLEAL